MLRLKKHVPYTWPAAWSSSLSPDVGVMWLGHVFDQSSHRWTCQDSLSAGLVSCSTRGNIHISSPIYCSSCPDPGSLCLEEIVGQCKLNNKWGRGIQGILETREHVHPEPVLESGILATFPDLHLLLFISRQEETETRT